MPLSVVAEMWLESRFTVKRRTLESDRGGWRNYIAPTFGRRPVASIVDRWSAGKGPGEWLFAAPAGGPLRETNWQRSVSWREAKATIGRPELRVHDLRHTAASVWLASGADPKVAAGIGRDGGTPPSEAARSGWSQSHLQPAGEGQAERAEGGIPALHRGRLRPACRVRCARSWAGRPVWPRSRARLSSTSRIASHNSLTTASSLGKWPRFLMIFRS